MTGAALLRWCRSHDWGRDAYLSADGQVIGGLLEVETCDGKVTPCRVLLPANYRVIARWAGYDI